MARAATSTTAKAAARIERQQAKRWAAVAAESPVARTRRARRMYRELHDLYPYAHCELDFRSPWELLIATVLSAQTTDVQVNLITPTLFATYPGPAELAAADREDVERIIQPTGFFRAKTKSIQGLAGAVLERYGGEVPGRLADLVTLPGVGRKTANVVLGNAFGVPGITVDTHFGRLSRRMGWTTEEDPVKVELEVGALFPKRDWTMLSHVLIFHGRRTCHAKRPACGACPVAALCPSYGSGETDPVLALRLLKYERAAEALTTAEGQVSAPVPGWLGALASRLDRFPPLFPDGAPTAPEGTRHSAVLILFGPVDGTADGPPDGPMEETDAPAAAEDELARVDILLTERSHDMRSHAGQVAFPGGAIDPGDDGPVEAALREAQEETGLDVSGVRVLGLLPSAYLMPSGYIVTPVLAWWERPSPVAAVDPREVARVARVALADLLAAANRFRVRHPSGYVGPGFEVDGLFVWGATAQMLHRVLTEAGLERPWDTERFEDLPALQVALRERRAT